SMGAMNTAPIMVSLAICSVSHWIHASARSSSSQVSTSVSQFFIAFPPALVLQYKGLPFSLPSPVCETGGGFLFPAHDPREGCLAHTAVGEWDIFFCRIHRLISHDLHGLRYR